VNIVTGQNRIEEVNVQNAVLIEIQRMNGQYDNIHKNVITMMDSKID
jgi:hypothetical protein